MKNIRKVIGLIVLLMAIFLIAGCEMNNNSGGESTTTTDGIFFNTNGGSEIESKTNLAVDTKVSLPESTKEGYTFVGWYKNAELTGSKLPATYTYPGGHIELYASWMPNDYKVYLDGGEVELTLNPLTVFYNEPVVVDNPESEYYNFLGWSYDDELIDENFKMPSHDITLIALWGTKEFTVTLDLDGGIVSGFVSSYHLQSGDSIELPQPTKPNTIFMGWYDSQGIKYTSSTKFYKETSLKAQYKSLEEYEATYKITYVANGGTVPSGYDEYEVGKEFILPKPLKAGYDFLGWYDNDIFYGDAITKLSNTTVYDQTLYAKWNEVRDVYVVTFINKDKVSKEYIERGDSAYYKELDDNLTWYLGNTVYDFVTPIESDITLYANFLDLNDQYEKIVPSVTKSDLTFTKQLTVNGNYYTFTYSSSDPNTLSNQGVVNPDHFNKIVTVTVTTKCGSTSISQPFEVIVPKIIFSDLTTYKPVFAYVYAGSHKQFSDVFMNTVDVVNLAFGRVTEDSTVSLNDVQAKLSTVLAVRKSGIRVILSLGGGGASLKQFSDAAYTAENRLKFANSLLEVVKQYHFDGIDIDWEYPGYNTGRDTSVDKPNYTLLVATIYQVLKDYNPELLITAALPGGRWGYERYALDRVEKYLDYIHLMTYDFHDSQYAYHHTALYPSKNSSMKSNVKESVELYVTQGVPIEKLVVGVAFYGRVYILSGPATTEKGIGSSNVIKSGDHMTYTEIYNYMKNNRGSYISYYDPEACAPSIYIPSENKVITYDNANSISAKCNYVNTTGVGGIMYWENGEDQTDSLLNALYKGMK